MLSFLGCVLFFAISCQVTLGCFFLISKKQIEKGEGNGYLTGQSQKLGDIEMREFKSNSSNNQHNNHDDSDESSEDEDDIDIQISKEEIAQRRQQRIRSDAI